MIVIDASTLTNALTDDGSVGQSSRAELARDPHWAAPENLVVETFSAIRGLYLGSQISRQRALDALDTMVAASVDLLGTIALLPRMWQLRDHVTRYDAAYVVAAETYDCPLVPTPDSHALAAFAVKSAWRYPATARREPDPGATAP